MDDTPEDKAPKTNARSRKAPSRKTTADAPVTKTKARSSSARRTKAEEAKPPRKAPAKRKVSAEDKAAAATAETKPATKKARAPAKAKQTRQAPIAAPVEPPIAPAVPADAKAPLPKPQPPAPADLPHTEESPDDVTIHPAVPHAASAHPHDEGLEFGLSPVDLAPDPGVREEAGLGWFIRILALSSVLLVLFNSFAIDKWAREQPVTRLNSQVLVAAHQLHAEMQSFHLDAPLESMRFAWHGIRDAHWPGSAANRENSRTENPPTK